MLPLIVLLGASAARGDTNEGIAAIKRGDYVTAIAQLLPEAEAGDSRAQANLASIYYYGLGIAANFAKAFRWYHASALLGNPDGQMGLAILYDQGQGAPLDLAIAHMWLTVAEDGMPPGLDRDRVGLARDAIASRLDATQLQKSASLVQAWYRDHRAP